MNISFENPDKVNGLLTITVEEADYAANVEKTLKDYRKKANVPGFRPGMVPMSLIKRQFGASVKMDEVNKLIGEQIYKYVKDNKIQMLGDPLPSDQQESVDIEKEGPYTFKFDIAVAPEFKCELTGRDKIDYYDITVDDALIDRQVDMFASQTGKYVSVEQYTEGDTMKGDLRELDENGNTKEGGLTVEGAMLMPSYIKGEDQKKLFDGAKAGDIITFNPRKAYPESDVEVAALLKVERELVAEHTGNFSYQITEINHFQKHAVDQELFDSVYGKDSCKDENDFRGKIAEGLKTQLATDSDFKFIQDVRTHCEKKVGKLEYPDAILKRIMLTNNKDKGQEFVDKNYEASLKELTWHLIKERLVAAHDIKISDAEVKDAAKEAARAQFAQYGMNNVPDEYVENYANEMLKKQEGVQPFVDRAIDRKLTEILKGVVKLNTKSISLDDFNKLMEP
ncbi:trigger factor [Prevotella sp. oral taxon 376]|uniref:trigger factor n=1 Tax=Prevotella sp. oral taxon 376 TaxID=712466 RepID=UPI000D1F925E|nr:trigger factor [Prevotella sp. oral taxon 376]PTL32487.1 trigger factor [Prevotella sp. oral taxon 376]